MHAISALRLVIAKQLAALCSVRKSVQMSERNLSVGYSQEHEGYF